MKIRNLQTGAIALGIVGGLLGTAQSAEASISTLVDRGLPGDLNTENSVRWLPPEAFNSNPENARFKGDDFTVETGNKPYLLDSLSIFVAPGFKSVDGTNNNPANLADWFKSTFLRVDQNHDGNLTADETVSAGNFDADTDSIDNSHISYAKTGQQYTSGNGAQADIWEVTYGNLGLMFDAGKSVRFGVKGLGREIGNSGFYFPWFLMAANADTSGYTPEQNASTDDAYLEFYADGTFQQEVDSGAPDGGWNKSSDILVKARGMAKEEATDIPEPSFLLGMAGILGAGLTLKRRRATSLPMAKV